MKLLLLFLTALVLQLSLSQASSGGAKKPNYNFDRSGSGLRQLFNSPVVRSEKMVRPLDGSKRAVGFFSHSGVRLTLADGSRVLVHKGKGYGRNSQTVVTEDRHMSDAWRPVQSKELSGQSRVSDFVRAGGSSYNVLTRNCHHASKKMMKLNK